MAKEQDVFPSLCGVCGANTVKSRVKCALCNTYYHNSCTSKLKNILLMEEKDIIMCCGNKNENDNKLTDSEATAIVEPSDRTIQSDWNYENKLLKEIITGKDDLIKELREKVDLLKEKIQCLEKHTLQVNYTSIIPKKTSKDKSINAKTSAKCDSWCNTNTIRDKPDSHQTKGNISVSTKPITSAPTQQQYKENVPKQLPGSSHAGQTMKPNKQPTVVTNQKLQEELDKIKLQEIIHLEDYADKDNSNEPWINVLNKSQYIKNKKNHGTSQIIVGERNEDDVKFKAVQKESKIWVHASRFHPDLSEDELRQHLNYKFNRNDFTCEKIHLKEENKTSSFKIGAHTSLKEEIYDAGKWAAGIVVRRFNFFRAARYQRN